MKIFSSLSHELRTPLNCSNSALDLLRLKIGRRDLIEQYIEPAIISNNIILN